MSKDWLNTKMLINKHKPRGWQGKYILLCQQSKRSKSTPYAMYCNLIRVSPLGNAYLEVFGDKWWGSVGTIKNRYVPRNRVVKYSDYFEE